MQTHLRLLQTSGQRRFKVNKATAAPTAVPAVQPVTRSHTAEKVEQHLLTLHNHFQHFPRVFLCYNLNPIRDASPVSTFEGKAGK